MVWRILRGTLAAAFVLSVLVGCSTSKETANLKPAPPDPLRVGVAADYPPLIFKIDNKIAGVEADLARLLAEKLGKPLQFVQMDWKELLPGLMAGKMDIIMSGMTITLARKMQVDFTEPYYQTRIVTAMRSEDVKTYDTLEKIKNTQANVGVIWGTAADATVQRDFPYARRMAIAKVDHAALELKNRRIDLFVADDPAVVWLVSRNEADLAGFWKPLATQELGWAVRRGNRELLETANRMLNGWKSDGTLRQVLIHWLPYLDRIQSVD
jgi:polar amino acid transport system substrate-binding protein